MELGAVVCVPNGQAKCEECPVASACLACRHDKVEGIPVKAPKKARTLEDKTVFIIQDGEYTAIRKRPEKGLLAGLYELPNVMGHLERKEALSYVESLGLDPLYIEKLSPAKHIFSHIEWRMQAYRIKVSSLKKTQDKKTRAYLINYFLEQFRTTLYRQTMFAEFELKINELVQNGGSLTAEGLNKIYHDLNVFYYGDAVVVDDLIDREWARIPHFYYNYYVFQYSTGFSAAMALSERILSEGESAVKDYLNFLSGGCSKDPISLLQGAGVDMRTAEPVHRALKLFDSLLDEMEALMEA